MATPRRLFALDHNFPEPVLNAFADLLPMVELVPIAHKAKTTVAGIIANNKVSAAQLRRHGES